MVGRLVYRIQVDENMVRFGENLYLPIRLKRETVLWRQKFSPQDWDESGAETARLYLLARPGDYYVTGTFTENWRGKLKLAADPLALSGRDLGSKQLFYVDVGGTLWPQPGVQPCRSQETRQPLPPRYVTFTLLACYLCCLWLSCILSTT